MADVAAEIAAQRARNHARWGASSIELAPPAYNGWLPTLVEEVGEVAAELQTSACSCRHWSPSMVNSCTSMALACVDWSSVRAELVDVAAVALMWIDSIDRQETP